MAKKKSFKSEINPALSFISTIPVDDKKSENPKPITNIGDSARIVEEKDSSNNFKYIAIEKKSKRIQLLIQPSLYDRIKAKAVSDGKSVNDTIHTILSDAVNQDTHTDIHTSVYTHTDTHKEVNEPMREEYKQTKPVIIDDKPTTLGERNKDAFMYASQFTKKQLNMIVDSGFIDDSLCGYMLLAFEGVELTETQKKIIMQNFKDALNDVSADAAIKKYNDSDII